MLGGTAQLVALLMLLAEPLGPGDHRRAIEIDGVERSYLVHVPPAHDANRPAPVVLVLHGAGTNARMTVDFTGMNDKADQAGFVAVYPNGTGLAGVMLTWNAGGWLDRKGKPDDVAFIARVLDDLAAVVRVDLKRVYAAGMSNGGMMCYRLAAELSDRIAAIAPVAGTLALEDYQPKRPVPVIHFHGTADRLVPFGPPRGGARAVPGLKSVEETIALCAKANGCPEQPAEDALPDRADDGTTVRRRVYGPGKDGSEVVLIVVEGGGHTWPGRQPPIGLIGKSTEDISANDLIWAFFEKHPMK